MSYHQDVNAVGKMGLAALLLVWCVLSSVVTVAWLLGYA